jgi:hypothetical protein
MSKNKKRLATLVNVFAFTLILGFVYAATNGILNFSGVVTFGDIPGTESGLTVTPVIDEAEDGNSYGTLLINGDGSVSITAHIDNPGDELQFVFSIENQTDDNYIITAVSDDADAPIELGGTYAGLGGVPIDSGCFEHRTVTVGWNGVEPANTESNFTIDMTYELMP